MIFDGDDSDVDMDALSPISQSAATSTSTAPRKRNRAYVDLPPLPANLRAAHRRMIKKARLEEAESVNSPSPEERARADAEKARQEGASASR